MSEFDIEKANVFVEANKDKIQHFVSFLFFTIENNAIMCGGIVGGFYISNSSTFGANIVGVLFMAVCGAWAILRALNSSTIVKQRIWLANNAK